MLFQWLTFHKLSYFIDPFHYLFSERLEQSGGSVVVEDELLKEDGFNLLLESGDKILLD